MKKATLCKALAILVTAAIMSSGITAFALTVPEEYREFTRTDSNYYHSLTITTSTDVEIGKVVKRTKTPADGNTFEAYYVSTGNKTLKLSTPDGEILTAQQLDEYFSQVPQTVPEADPMAWEKEMLSLVNAERERLGIAPVEPSTDLTEIAALRASEMSELNYFSHTSPNYGNPSQFAKYYGYKKSISENIHHGTSSTPQQVFDLWLNSTTGHRENMLNLKWKYIGIGTTERFEYNSDGSIKSTDHYNVQLFSE